MRSSLMVSCAIAAIALCARPAAQQHAGSYTAADVENGARLYGVHCSSCHGADGALVASVDLRRGVFRFGSSDEEISRTIARGIPGTAMTPQKFSAAELHALVAYIRSMRDFGARRVAAGDPTRGETLFEQKGCLSCHRVNGRGSLFANDLSDIGSVRSMEALDRVLTEGTDVVSPQRRFIRAATADGRTVSGRRLNEDTFTVQLIDDGGRLVSLVKSELREYTVTKASPRPAGKEKLTADERAHLTAYLATLKGVATGTATVPATAERLLKAAGEPHNWLTYSGDYASRRHSRLDQITPANVASLEQQWVFHAQSLEKFGATPLVVDGVMYVTQANNHVAALDAKTGRVFWIYQYTLSPKLTLCCGSVNRGVAILGDTLFMGTLDGYLIALDARNGRPIWKVLVADASIGYSLTMAPLVIKDKVLMGTAGGEYGIRGFVAAYDARTGKEAWRFTTIPGPGEPGHETWQGDAWKTGGGSAWLTGSYDPELNLTYWGIGNPGPDFAASQRPGDNLYTNSVVALDADTGALKWHFQFTPHDSADWDAVQVPVLVDAEWQGSPRKLLYWANRNGFFYAFDRVTGKFLFGKPFVKQNWATGLDANGRPILASLPEGSPVFPGIQGGTNWYSPSYSPRTGLFYVSAWDDYSSVFTPQTMAHVPGQRFMGGRARSGTPPLRRGAINAWTEEAGHGAVLAIDPKTGERKWAFAMHDVTDAGILTTAADLLFTGGREGYFFALDARNGSLLWKATVGGQVGAAPITYQVDGKQYVAIAAGNVLYAYALRQ